MKITSGHPHVLPPSLVELFAGYPEFCPVSVVTYHVICLDEGAPKSVVGVPQWLAFLRLFHLPPDFYCIAPLQNYITFGEKGSHHVRIATLAHIQIRVALPGHTYFDYTSFLISNDIPILLRLATQMNLNIQTHKH